VVAVVVLNRGTPHSLGNPVAASSKHAAGPGTTQTGPGTASKGGATKTGGSASSLPGHKGNAGLSTRAARNGGASSGGSGTTGASPSIDPTSAASPAVNLPVPAGFGPVLRHTWASANPGGAGITASDIVSTEVGSVFYAEQPAVHTYWAIAQFVPSALAESRGSTPAGATLLAAFHGTAEFEKLPGHHWAYVGSFSTGTCSGGLPVPVLTTWGLCAVGS
jgi:hypothetical protein